MPGLWVAFRATLVYVTVLALGMTYMFQVVQVPYGSIQMITHFWWIELLLTAVCLYYLFRYFGATGAGFGPINWPAVLWLVPSYLVVAGMLFMLWPRLADPIFLAAHSDTLLWLAITTFLVGFSEEVMFRGILLRGAMAQAVPIRAMLISAFAFSLLHVVNGFGGQPLAQTIHQLAFTFLVGFFLAPVALKIGNLWPLIIWHFLWDFAVFGSAMVGLFQPFALIGMLFQVVLGLYLWAQLARGG